MKEKKWNDKSIEPIKKWNNKSVEPLWVTKYVSRKEWNVLKEIDSYCYLSGEDNNKFGKIKVGFLVAGSSSSKVPKDCLICTDEELRIIDLHRRANKRRPFPLKEVSNKDSRDTDEVLAKMPVETSDKMPDETSDETSDKTSNKIPFAF